MWDKSDLLFAREQEVRLIVMNLYFFYNCTWR